MQPHAVMLQLLDDDEAFSGAFAGAVLAALPPELRGIYSSGVNAGIKSERQKAATARMRSHQELCRRALQSAELYRERILVLAIEYAALDLKDALKPPEGYILDFPGKASERVS